MVARVEWGGGGIGKAHDTEGVKSTEKCIELSPCILHLKLT